MSVLDRLVAEGKATRATGDLLKLKRPPIRIDRPASELLDEQRAIAVCELTVWARA
jgi:hypothetical protein